jgi:hypothetical protein
VATQNAASVAALLVTTEARVAELPKKNAGAGGGASRRRHGRYGLLSPTVKRQKKEKGPVAISALAAGDESGQLETFDEN